MGTPVRAIETTGIIDEKRQLKLDTPLPVTGPSRVRIIVLIPEEEYEKTSEAEWLHAAATNPALDFLKNPEEDIDILADRTSLDGRARDKSDYRMQMVEDVCALFGLLPRLDHQTTPSHLPQNGIYVFFERGEIVQWRDTAIDRIVRIGTHRKDDRFKKRIRQHYGNVHSLGGNKNGSVFRKHLGGALLRRLNPQDTRLENWLKQGKPSFAEVEEMVSHALRESFIFSCFRVDQQEERQILERGLIALLAQCQLDQPSANWLGKYAASDKIRHSGLWNIQHINADPLPPKNFQRLKQLVYATLEKEMV